MNDIRFSKTHEWIKLVDNHVFIGITDYAQSRLGSIVFVDLPEAGKKVELNEEIAAIESVKAASELIAPLSGTILKVNERLLDEPELLNSDPNNAWIVKIKYDNIDDFNQLLDLSAYEKLIK